MITHESYNRLIVVKCHGSNPPLYYDIHSGENKLNGTIPSELGLIDGLEEIDFSDNDLTGSIPSEIGLIEDLEEIDLGT